MIRGERVAIRTVRRTDLDALYLLVNDSALKGEHLAPPLRSETAFRKDFDETGLFGSERGCFLVTDLDDRLLGDIAYFKVNYMDGFEIGYQSFDPASRGSGLMTEALRLVVRYLFEHHKINRLQIATGPGNEASKRLALKCGFRLEGTLRGFVLHRGHPADVLIYALLRDEALGR
ncbi:MAG TPA: GNAT family protein [Burkholderiaceae bacterium]|mgnify:CR=1 FL=1|jgi:RimJ/RimL family protein N-acetyltransferase|nr:GNAT family protein [Burkholderiaceae bacterium]